ncbi:TPA: hypothetical protein ACS55J_005293 [Salmonella enterica]
MAIGVGWVGSQAVAETGQRWMSAAGSAVKVPVPFWMSSLVGKSVMDVAYYAAISGYCDDRLNNYEEFWYTYALIDLTSPFTGTITTSSPYLEVSTSDAYFIKKSTYGVNFGRSISVSNITRIFVGRSFDDTKFVSDCSMIIQDWRLVLNGSPLPRSMSTSFVAKYRFDYIASVSDE